MYINLSSQPFSLKIIIAWVRKKLEANLKCTLVCNTLLGVVLVLSLEATMFHSCGKLSDQGHHHTPTVLLVHE